MGEGATGRRWRWCGALLLAAVLAGCADGGGGDAKGTSTAESEVPRPAAPGPTVGAPTGAPCDSTLALPDGFCATVFADTVGGARHVTVAANGDVFVQLMTGKKSAESGSGRTGGVLALRDTDRDGAADTSALFGELGGTGIALHNGYLYADGKSRVVRWRLPQGTLVPEGAAEAIVTGLPLGGHEARNIALDTAGNLYVNVGSLTNSCQRKDRGDRSPGRDRCTELRTRAGIWKFSASKPRQTQSTGQRFATGIRNAIGLTVSPLDGKVYATQHGRDQLAQNWGFSALASAENPAEELLQVNAGDDFGWPYCYFHVGQQKLVLAPEYGGDSTRVGRCAEKKAPLATYPGHWAPMSLLFYTGTQFPERYRGGAFIAFHGSWNRAPEPQEGYRVVFQPMADGQPTGAYETFADGFAGGVKQPGTARHRPVGLAQGPDGALYITDDKGGRIWKVSYRR